MEKREGAQIIREMITNIVNNPNQFNIEINVSSVGFQASNTGGIGFVSNPVGGGPGSTTIGMQASGPSNIDMQIMRDRGNSEFSNQLNQALNAMNAIADELDKNEPDETLLQRTYGFLKESIIPAVVTAVVNVLIKQTTGLHI